MFEQLRSLLFGDAAPQETATDPRHLAACALMVEAARMDGSFDPVERERIAALVKRYFDLDDAQVTALIREAEETMERSVQLVPFTQTLKNHYSEAQRTEIIEMLWEVVYADGRLDDYEANLLRRLAGLIYVPDQEVGAARKRVLARMGLDDDQV